jgi:hypothetical protein
MKMARLLKEFQQLAEFKFIITLPVREVVEETPKPKEALLQDIQKENNKNIQLEFSDIYAD